jgi:HEPN domain-containing protein
MGTSISRNPVGSNLGYYIPTRYPDALAPPAVPFESYTQEQGARAVAAVQALVVLVTQKFSPAPE